MCGEPNTERSLIRNNGVRVVFFYEFKENPGKAVTEPGQC